MPKSHDFIKTADELKQDVDKFVLSVERWKALKHLNFKWDSVCFKKSEASKIPAERGIYAFIIKPDINSINGQGYLVYIGESGQVGNHNLRKRFKDYLKELVEAERTKVAYYLVKYEKHMYFYFTPIKDKRRNLKTIEKDFTEAFVPNANIGDFYAATKKAVKAFR